MMKSKLRIFRDHFYPGHLYLSGHAAGAFTATGPSSMSAPLLHQNRHYRYKSRYGLIPSRGAPLHSPVIIRHPPPPPHHPTHHPLTQFPHSTIHPPFKYLTIRDNQGHFLRPHTISRTNKLSFFNNCWPL